MKKFTLLFLSLLCVPFARADQPNHSRNQLLVQFKAGTPKAKIDEVVHGHGATLARELKALGIHVLQVPDAALENVQAALSKNPHVKFVEKDFLANGGAAPNDPLYSSQWHHTKINSSQAWDISQGSVTAPIAIVDSGVDSAHPEFSGKLLSGFSYLTRTADTRDVLGHGTAVAGAAAALGNNGLGVSGLAQNNPIVPLVVLDSNDYASYSNIAEAITDAADQNIRIINVSIGGSSASTTLQNAVTYAWNRGALVFAAAMNAGVSAPNYPAACTNAIAVASTDANDNRSSFSNFGSWLTLSAPGSSIYTTSNGGGYSFWNGTSFASPLSAALGALVLSVNPGFTQLQVRELLKANSDDLGTAGFDLNFGYGRINAYRTLVAAQNMTPAPDLVAPAVTMTSPAQNATVSALVTAAVTAEDNVGVTYVELFVDGVSFASDTSTPYLFSWDTTKVSNGFHQLTAFAQDAAGNSSWSNPVSVNVANSIDTIAPGVKITNPANGSSIARLSKVTIKSSATDNVAVTRMELYIDGTKVYSANSASLSWNWRTTPVSAGTHGITIKAFDAAGNQGAVSINVVK